MDSKKIERRAADWLARSRSENWSEADQDKLDAWLSESTAHRVAWLRLNAAWRQSDRLKALGAGMTPGEVPERGHWASSSPAGTREAETVSDQRETKASSGEVRGSSWKQARFASVAAVVILAVSVAWLWRQYDAEETAHFYTGVGGIKEVSLADGTTATLGSGSELQVTLSRHLRQIHLERGEAYFDVAHDAAREFEVHAGGQRVVAVGTRFAVRHDADELRVVVTEGAVRLEPAEREAASSELLTGGMIATVRNGGDVDLQQLSVDRAEELLSWREGFLVFRNTPLSEVVAEFNRYNSRKLVIADPAIAEVPIGGNFRWTNTDAFVRLLEQGFDVRAQQRGNEIILDSR